MPILRSFSRADQLAARRLILQGLGDHFGFIDETRNPDVDDICANYMDQGHTFVVVENNGELIGTGALKLLREHVAQMVRVSVDGAYRRRGVGRLIVEHLVRVAQDHGVHRVLVETNNDWDVAISLYRNCGFRESGRDDESVYMVMDISA